MGFAGVWDEGEIQGELVEVLSQRRRKLPCMPREIYQRWSYVSRRERIPRDNGDNHLSYKIRHNSIEHIDGWHPIKETRSAIGKRGGKYIL